MDIPFSSHFSGHFLHQFYSETVISWREVDRILKNLTEIWSVLCTTDSKLSRLCRNASPKSLWTVFTIWMSYHKDNWKTFKYWLPSIAVSSLLHFDTVKCYNITDVLLISPWMDDCTLNDYFFSHFYYFISQSSTHHCNIPVLPLCLQWFSGFAMSKFC